MHASLLVKLLSALPSELMAALHSFLDSPYFNTNPTLLALFEILERHHPTFKTDGLTKEQVFSSLFPGKAYHDGTMRNLMAKLAELIRQFLAQEKFKASPALQDRLLLQQYGKYKLESGFNALYKKQITRMEKASKMDRFACLEHYLTLDKMTSYSFVDGTKLGQEYSMKLSDHLDRFFALSKLNLKLATNERLTILGEQPPFSHFDNALNDYTKAIPKAEKPAFDFLNNISIIQKKTKLKAIEKSFQGFQSLYTNFTAADNEAIFRILQNLHTRTLKIGDSKSIQKLFQLLKFGVDKNIITANNYISHTGFLNIVTVGARSGNSAWAMRFIEDHIYHVAQNEQKEVEVLARSIIQFERKDYDAVFENLKLIKLRGSKLGFHYRLLMVKNLIELSIKHPNTTKSNLRILDTIEKYAKRQKTNYPNIAVPFHNFTKVARKLLLDIKKEGLPEWSTLKTLIRLHAPMSATNWLTERSKSLK